jgi:hypothetical protein
MNSCTEGFDCLVLDNTSRSNKITDCIFWYRAKPNRKFKIGSKELWSYHDKNYNKQHMIEEEQLDIDKTKKKPGISVKKVKNVKKLKTVLVK